MRILLLDLDTTRPDHLGCYGYRRNTSPNLDRIAREGVIFTNCYCSDAPCLPSRAALMSGRFGIHTGIVGHSGTAAEPRSEGESRNFWGRTREDSVIGLLRDAGFHTVSVSPFAERHGAWWFYAGFREIYKTGKLGWESAEDVTPTVLDWIERNAERDSWFLHVNYWDPHTPYRAPVTFGNPFNDDPIPTWLTPDLFAQHRRKVGPHSPHEINGFTNEPLQAGRFPRQPSELRNLDDVKRMIDGYDCGIAYMDSHIGQLFAALKEKGLMDDLVVIVMADHGENMGELGIYGEHGTADHSTCRIPMIIRWPGCREGQVDHGLHYSLDLAPTLAELLGQPPREIWDGQSYAPALLEGRDCGREYLVLGQCAHVCQRSVRFGPSLYMRTYHDGYHLFPDEMLFDVETDHEQADLAPQRPELCRQAMAYLQQWHERMMSSMLPGASDPLWTVLHEGGPCHAKGQLASYCKRLEETGRGWAIPELRRRHPREFI